MEEFLELVYFLAFPLDPGRFPLLLLELHRVVLQLVLEELFHGADVLREPVIDALDLLREHGVLGAELADLRALLVENRLLVLELLLLTQLLRLQFLLELLERRAIFRQTER